MMKWAWSGHMDLEDALLTTALKTALLRNAAALADAKDRIKELEAEVRYYREALSTVWRVLVPIRDLLEPQP